MIDDNSTIICDVSTAQYDINNIQYDILVICYSRLITYGYHNPLKKGNCRIFLIIHFILHNISTFLNSKFEKSSNYIILRKYHKCYSLLHNSESP